MDSEPSKRNFDEQTEESLHQSKEKSLHESTAILTAINESTPTLLFVKDRQGYMVMANPATIQAIGKPEAEIIGYRDVDFHISREEGEKMMENDRRVMESGQMEVFEETLELPTGRRTFLSTKSPYRDERGNIIGLIGVATDITERLQIEQALQESEEQYRLTIDLTHTGSWDWWIASGRVSWNDNHFRLLGLAPGEVQSSYQAWRDRIYPEDIERVEAALALALTTQTDFETEYRVVYPDGSLHWLVGKGRGIYNQDGQPVRMLGVLLDITDRKKAELALTSSEERFRDTFEKAAVGVGNTNLKGRWLQVNQKLCDIVGYTREELLKMTFRQITHPDDLEIDVNLARQLLAGEIPNYSLEKRYIRKDGSPVWVNISVSLRREPPSHLDFLAGKRLGKPKYFIGIIEDISDRKKIEFELHEQEQELRQLNQTLSQTTELLKKRNQELDSFVYVVSHDLKAPLRAIANLSQWLEDDLEGQLPPENQHQMQLMRQRVYRLEALIDGLLAYSRADRTQAAVEKVDVGELLAEVIDMLAPPPGFSIEVQLGMPKLITKRILLSQVFANLISNAIKHHQRPDGRVEISGQKRGKLYEFTVSDDGPGIEPEYHEKIFNIFQTLKARDSQENTGIGLSIVKKIIETEGGEIKVESEAGKGAIFRFTWLAETK